MTRLIAARFKRPVLVSLVRAGVPCGVLMRRYAARMLGRDFLHYGVSIIRGKGFDENAIHLILRRHPGQEIVFVDGWTGKGMITTQLEESCRAFNERNGTALRPTLAVLADPAHCCSLYATREDFINPSCCLNSTICGLISRSVHNRSIIGPEDFHGARVYHEFAAIDQTACYLDTVSSWFSRLDNEISAAARALDAPQPPPDWRGMQAVRQIGAAFGIADINRIKAEHWRNDACCAVCRIVFCCASLRIPTPESMVRLLAQGKGRPHLRLSRYAYLCCGLIADRREGAV